MIDPTEEELAQEEADNGGQGYGGWVDGGGE